MVAALYREQAARFTVDLIRGELLPTVQLEANYAKRFDDHAGIDSAETTTRDGPADGAVLHGRRGAGARAAGQAHARQRLQEIEQARTEMQAQVVAAWSQLQAAQAQLESDHGQVDANRIALAGVREEERVGQRTLLDVLNAEQELLNAEVNLVTTSATWWWRPTRCCRPSAASTRRSWAWPALVYDPEAHYHEVRRKWFDINITHADGRREALAGRRRRASHRPAK